MIEDIPLKGEIETEILMHRDAHFGGSFPVMLDYYLRDGKGVRREFDLRQIETLQSLEKERKENLAPLLLSGAEAEAVAEARAAYQSLRDVYKNEGAENKIPRLITDLILTEDPLAFKEVAAVVKEGKTIVPALIELLRSPKYYNPLFPGYGHAPIAAAKCLGEIGDKRAIITLFESIGSGDLFDEEVVIKALKLVGEPAQTFLLTVLKSRPYNLDNERAAIALIPFNDNPQVTEACLTLLQDPDIYPHIPFATYLIFCCETLEDKTPLRALADNPDFPEPLRTEIHSLIT